MGKVKQYEETVKGLVDQANDLQKSFDPQLRAEARGMLRVINVLELARGNVLVDTGIADAKGNNVRIGDTVSVTAKDLVDIVEQDIDNQCPSPEYPKLFIGDTISDIGKLRYLLQDLDDCDQICIVSCDEHGDEVDHYPMAIDVIEGIKLIDDTVVREVQFIQRPNSAPDTRDKTELVETLIQGGYRDSEKDIIELLKTVPWEILKMKLPEDQRSQFDTVKVDINVQEDEDYKQGLIVKVMTKYYNFCDPESVLHKRRLHFLNKRYSYELEKLLRDDEQKEIKLS